MPDVITCCPACKPTVDALLAQVAEYRYSRDSEAMRRQEAERDAEKQREWRLEDYQAANRMASALGAALNVMSALACGELRGQDGLGFRPAQPVDIDRTLKAVWADVKALRDALAANGPEKEKAG